MKGGVAADSSWGSEASQRVLVLCDYMTMWQCAIHPVRLRGHVAVCHQPTSLSQACKENADAFLFLFSFTDRASFEDLPGQLMRVAGEAPGVVKIVIGSKYPLSGL